MITFPPNDPPVESYLNTRANPPCENLRWRVPGYPIIGGGSIVDADDWAHLRDAFDVSHVLNIDSKSDAGIVPSERLCEVQVTDNGMAIAAPLLGQCCDFYRNLPAGSMLYVHSGNGGARAPAVVYTLLRSVHGLSHEDGLIATNRAFPHSLGFHFGYLDGHRCAIGSIDLAIDEGAI